MISLEGILPYDGAEEKGVQIERMFNTIAGKYDRLNHLLSLGFDRQWRRRGVDSLRPYHPETILDVASGTGDMAIWMCRRLNPKQVTGADISRNMMVIGAKKVLHAGFSDKASFEYQDCMSLSYADHSFDAVTVAFGVRNFARIEQGLSEMYRVLKPDGRVMILELSTPDRFPLKQLYQLYSKVVISFAGSLFSMEKAAYEYLPASVKAMPQGREMMELLSRQGFTGVQAKTFTWGVCSLYTGSK
jgi:demethylmenaquinone methyltransferase/2-methoxy-6-polyprenyl-1,4-benzoquinol methylase